MTSSPELRERILASVRSEPAPTRREAAARSLTLLVSAALATAGIFLAIGGVRAAPRPTGLLWATVVGAAALASTALWLAVRRGGTMVGRPRAWLWAVALATPLALFLWKIAWSAQFAGMMVEWPTRVGLRCLGYSLLMASAPLGALVLLRRRSGALHPVASGAALGVAGGAIAWVLVDLWCPVAFPSHLLLGHVLPIAILAASGAALGKWLMGIRAR